MHAPLQQLRKLAVSAADLTVPWNFFHDHVASSLRFMEMGRPDDDPVLLQTIAKVGGHVLGTEVSAQQACSLHLPEHGLRHGVCGLGAHAAVWFHFEAPDVGLLGLMRNLACSEVAIVRFSRVALTAPGLVGRRAQA